MVFGFFSRKSESAVPVVDAGPSTTATTSADPLQHFQFPPKQQHTPAPSIDLSSSQLKYKQRPSPAGSDLSPPAGPIDTPSPGLGIDGDKGDEPDEARLTSDPATLHALIASVPPQTLHAYTLAHLSPNPPSAFPFANPAAGLILHAPPTPPSPTTVSVLTSFFSKLTPPPKLHCVRCHQNYFELENTDWSCRVPHDDESAIVDRVRTGLGAEYETLWGCCGKTVEGDGDQGPPDGWCYEGRHTTDMRRARFRADSSSHDDKLIPCAQLRCGEPPLPKRVTSRLSRKRTRMEGDTEEVEESPSVASSSHSRSLKGHRESDSKSSLTKGKADEDDKHRPAKRPRSRKPSSISLLASKRKDEDAMDLDADDGSPPVSKIHPSPPKSPRRPPAPTSKLGKAKVKPKTRSSPSPKPGSKGTSGTTSVPLQKSPLSASFTATATAPPPHSNGIHDGSSRPSTPTKRTKVEVQILSKSPSVVHATGASGNRHALSKKGSVISFKAGSGKADLKAMTNVKTKLIGEVVETSVDGEAEWC